MEALLTASVVYYTTVFITRRFKLKDIILALSIFILILDYLLKFFGLYGINIVPIAFFLIFSLDKIGQKRFSKDITLVLAFFYYLILLVLSNINYFSNLKSIIALNFLALLFMFNKQIYLYKVWISINLFSFVFTFIYPQSYLTFSSLVLIYLTVLEIYTFIKYSNEEKEEFKIKLYKTIGSEVEKEVEKLDIKLQLAYKKLKELFRLNTSIIKESSIEEMAEKVVKGLYNLGYTGVYIILKLENISKKEGFIPNLRFYIERLNYTKDIETFEDKTIVILPLKDDNQIIGYLIVYSKISLIQEEIEFILTYTQSISNIITKTHYFSETIKLRDLIYRTIEGVNLGIVIIDCDFNIEILNQYSKNFSSNLEEKNIFETFPFLKQLKSEFEDVIKNKKDFETKIKVDYLSKIFEIKAYPIYSQENTVNSLVIIFEDVTEKEEMENHIIQSEKLAVIGRLAAGLSHEIKNPLTIINQTAYLLKRKVQKQFGNIQNTEALLESIKTIEKNVYRAIDIIERLLNFSKPYYSNTEKVNLKDIIDEAFKLAYLQSKKPGVKISKNMEDVYIKGDKNALIQLFLNLIINAFDAIENKGKITITLKLLKRSNSVKVSIKDTGKGIPEDILDKIFDPFFTTKEKGTGLGLAVCYKIVESHGGSISVKSEEGIGTEFIVTFNLSEDLDE